LKSNSENEAINGFGLFFECFEIYNETIIDLLSNNKEHLAIKEINKKYIVKDLAIVHLELSNTIYDDLLQIIEMRTST